MTRISMIVMFVTLAAVMVACEAGRSSNVEFIRQNATSGLMPGTLDYAILVDCIYYNSGESRGEVEVTAKLVNDFGEVEKKQVGGIAPGGQRTFTFTFDEARFLDDYRYQCEARPT